MNKRNNGIKLTVQNNGVLARQRNYVMMGICCTVVSDTCPEIKAQIMFMANIIDSKISILG
jgi:hypothetical protein